MPTAVRSQGNEQKLPAIMDFGRHDTGDPRQRTFGRKRTMNEAHCTWHSRLASGLSSEGRTFEVSSTAYQL